MRPMVRSIAFEGGTIHRDAEPRLFRRADTALADESDLAFGQIALDPVDQRLRRPLDLRCCNCDMADGRTSNAELDLS